MRVSICGNFFACPDCRGVCRNGEPILRNHFVCELCFARFEVVGHDEVQRVESVVIPARVLGAIEMLGRFGVEHMQQAYIDFHDAAKKLNRVYQEVYVPRFDRNKAQYDEHAKRARDAARKGKG